MLTTEHSRESPPSLPEKQSEPWISNASVEYFKNNIEKDLNGNAVARWVVWPTGDPEAEFKERAAIVKSIIKAPAWSKRSMTVPICRTCCSYDPPTNAKARRCTICKNTIRWMCRLCTMLCWDGGSSSYACHVNEVLRNSAEDGE